MYLSVPLNKAEASNENASVQPLTSNYDVKLLILVNPSSVPEICHFFHQNFDYPN